MNKLTIVSLLWASLAVAYPPALWAADQSLQLSNGTEVKVLFFKPQDAVVPPLAVLLPGGSNNEFMVRAQFWFGKEFVERGWAIAVPISPAGRDYFLEQPQVIPEIVDQLHATNSLRDSKALLIGISSGGSAALAVASQQPQHFLGVVATPGRLTDDVSMPRLQGLPIYLRIGERDGFRWQRELEHTVNLLHAAGASVDAGVVPDARHIFSLDWDNLQAWLDRLQPLR